MPTISKIRLCNVIYENGKKRYNDDIFLLDGNNSAFILENGGGKTVLVQMILQAVLPTVRHAERNVRDTLVLDSEAAHIAVEWILNEQPRRYLVTSVTLFTRNKDLEKHLYMYEYEPKDKNGIDDLPFVIETAGGTRPASQQEMNDYYLEMKNGNNRAKGFDTLGSYHDYLEKEYHIANSEWMSISKINELEGGVEKFFDNCNTTSQLVNNLIIPSVERTYSESQAKGFAETFEKHREHLKTYHYLSEDIEQNKTIKNYVDHYADLFSDYHTTKEDWQSERRKIKGIAEHIEKDLKAVNEAFSTLELEEYQYEQKGLKLNQKISSLEIARAEEQRRIYRHKHDVSEQNCIDKKAESEALEDELLKLELAKLRDDLSAENTLRDHLIEDLKYTEEDLNLTELTDQLSGIKGEIHYVFEKSIEIEKNEIQIIKVQVETYSDEMGAQLQTLQGLKDKKDERRKALESIETQIQVRRGDLENTKSKITGKEEQTSVKTYKNSLGQRARKIQNELLEIAEQNQRDQESLREHEREREAQREKLSKVDSDYQLSQEKKKDIEAKIKHICDAYQGIMGKPLENNRVYPMERSIQNSLMDRIERLIKDKEDQLLSEAFIQYEHQSYQSQNVFVADPGFMRIIDSWQEQFTVLHSGIQFLQNHFSDQMEEMMTQFSYWPMTVVTTESEKDKLLIKINANRDKLNHPVFVMSITEAKRTFNPDEIYQVVPQKWQALSVQSGFETWKKEISLKLEATVKVRKDIENQLREHNRLQNDLDRFYQGFPSTTFETLSAQLNQLENDKYDLRAQLSETNETIGRFKKSLNAREQKKSNLVEESSTFNLILSYCDAYLNIEEEIATLTKKKHELDLGLQMQNERIDSEERKLKQVEEQIKQLEWRANQHQQELDTILANQHYIQVQNQPSCSTDKPLSVLIPQLKHLTTLIHEGHEAYSQIEAKIQAKDYSIEALQQQLKATLERADEGMNMESLQFPNSGATQIAQLKVMVKNLGSEYSKLDRIEREEKSRLDNLEGELSNLKLKHQVLGEVILFTSPLNVVADELEIEKEQLLEAAQCIQSLRTQLGEQKALINRCRELIIGIQERFELTDESLETLHVDESFLTAYQYKPIETLKKEIEASTKVLNELNAKGEKIKIYQEEFKFFCSEKITNPKMKKLTLDALTYRDNYQAVAEWRGRLDQNINQALLYANESLKNLDEEINTYIERLYVYLDDVVSQINHIANKTKIDVEGVSKHIFQIQTPLYEESTARMAIREYLISMTHQIGDLENQIEVHMDKKDQEKRMRQFILEGLSTKTLLRIIFSGKDIKVGCRKVTNDFKISSSFTDWTSSNKWSGGEKWSKNMIFFLGIQNYIAERRHVDGVKIKGRRQRTVLLDNPFGKASSDHVLAPVFKIADQLGFQLISFTAHIEGKFISDYFPIVYSMKLRDTTRPDVQVMGNSKEINYAFLKDNNPMTVLRLGNLEQEQLGLF